jgi:RNA polymerase sigma-70 factor, ECF subfamily
MNTFAERPEASSPLWRPGLQPTGRGSARIRGGVAVSSVGERERIDREIAGYRDYLLLVADRAMTPALKTKEGASDLVQEALLAAHRASGQFQVRTAIELRAWLRRLLLNRVAHAARRYFGTEKRRLARELSLDADLNREAISDALALDQASPASVAARHEQEALLQAALERLPERMRQAVLWRHHKGYSFDEIGKQLGCTNVAARKLWLRALGLLQRELSCGHEGAVGPRLD